MSAHPHQPFDDAPHAGIPLAASEHAARLAALRDERRAVALKDAWKSMPETWRTVLVMLACSQAGRPELLARQPWESFCLGDQLEMARAARGGVESLVFFASVAVA